MLSNVGHRSTLAAVLGVVALAGSVLVAPPVLAQPDVCRVRNLDLHGAPMSDLQQAIRRADPGNTLEVRGVCVGTYTIRESLTLTARVTPGRPQPVLDGAGQGTVVDVIAATSSEVRLHNITVTGGDGTSGGIWIQSGEVTLSGSTLVTANEGVLGGGITNDGHLTLTDEAAVTLNRGQPETPNDFGGGVYNTGTLRMEGSSLVADNTDDNGGIYTVRGPVMLSDQASVTGNANDFGGAGISAREATVTLRDQASVTENQAMFGAGIRCNGGQVRLLGAATVSNNDAGIGTGGGILCHVAEVTLADHSVVSGNTANAGAGIYGDGTVITLGDSASVVGNSAIGKDRFGGGIASIDGEVVLNDDALVAGNSAKRGGGIAANVNDITLNDRARIELNTATLNGGGIWMGRESIITLASTSRITQNTAGESGGGIFVLNPDLVQVVGSEVVIDNIPDDCVGC